MIRRERTGRDGMKETQPSLRSEDEVAAFLSHYMSDGGLAFPVVVLEGAGWVGKAPGLIVRR